MTIKHNNDNNILVVATKTAKEIFINYILNVCQKKWVPDTLGMQINNGFLLSTWIRTNSIIGICQEKEINVPTAFIPLSSSHGIVVNIALDCKVSRLVEFDTTLLHNRSTVKKATEANLKGNEEHFLEENKTTTTKEAAPLEEKK